MLKSNDTVDSSCGGQETATPKLTPRSLGGSASRPTQLPPPAEFNYQIPPLTEGAPAERDAIVATGAASETQTRRTLPTIA